MVCKRLLGQMNLSRPQTATVPVHPFLWLSLSGSSSSASRPTLFSARLQTLSISRETTTRS